MRVLVPVVVVATGVLALSACSGDDAATTSSKSAEALRAAAATRTTLPDGSMGARKELTKDSCTADAAGAWSVKGTVTNTQKTPQTYVVTASVVDGTTFTVLGTKVFTERLDAGRSRDVAAAKFFTSKADGARCVLRVTRKAA